MSEPEYVIDQVDWWEGYAYGFDKGYWLSGGAAAVCFAAGALAAWCLR